MLDRTRPEALELAPLDADALLQRIFDATAPALDARGVRLVAEFKADLPRVAGDADRLQQVFINLINNALDAMPDGGELRVRTATAVAVEEDDRSDDRAPSNEAGQVIVEFADTGCGMTEEVRSRIFDPHFTTKERGRGAGLGLVVVRQVMREHGGEIEVESEAGRGALFRLRFPAIREDSTFLKEEVEAVSRA